MATKKAESDYGETLLKAGKSMANLHPFIVDRVDRVTSANARLLGTVLVGSETFAAIVDAPSYAVSQLIDASPPRVSLPLRKFLDGRFTKTDSRGLPQRVAVQVAAKVGAEPETDGRVPFKALSVAPATMPEFEETNPAASKPEPVVIDPDEEIVVLQMSPDINDIVPGLGAPGLVTTVLLQCLAAGSPPTKKRAWTAYIASRPHFQQLTLWVGLSSNMPPELISVIQDRFELMRTDVSREMSTPSHDEMIPLLRTAGRDIFFLVPEENAQWLRAATALSGVPTRRGAPTLKP